MAETEATEVEFEDALAEEKEQDQGENPSQNAFMRPRPQTSEPTLADADADQSPEPAPAPEANSEAQSDGEDAEEDLEVLVSKAAAKQWTFGSGEYERTYLQQELSVIGFAQWSGLVGEFLDKAMSGENALTLNALLTPPQLRQKGQPLSIQSFQDADVFVHALGKLVQFAPEFLSKSVCIWLNVPDYEWELVQDLMGRSPSNGGMSYEDFQEILEIFIDQNYSEINRFFRVRQRQIRDRWQTRAKEANRSRSSKR